MKRREAFALLWFLSFPLLIYLDGNIVSQIGLFPWLPWDTALKYYYMALAGVDAVIILLYGFVLRERGVE